jgi:hypothetical protein
MNRLRVRRVLWTTESLSCSKNADSKSINFIAERWWGELCEERWWRGWLLLKNKSWSGTHVLKRVLRVPVLQCVSQHLMFFPMCLKSLMISSHMRMFLCIVLSSCVLLFFEYIMFLRVLGIWVFSLMWRTPRPLCVYAHSAQSVLPIGCRSVWPQSCLLEARRWTPWNSLEILWCQAFLISSLCLRI